MDAYLEAFTGNTYRFIDTAGIKQLALKKARSDMVRKRGRINSETMWLSINRSMKAMKRADVAVLVLLGFKEML